MAACFAAANAFSLFCLAVTLSLIVLSAEATDGGRGMLAGLKGSASETFKNAYIYEKPKNDL